MTELQGTIVIIYLAIIFFQNLRIIQLLSDVKDKLIETEKEQ